MCNTCKLDEVGEQRIRNTFETQKPAMDKMEKTMQDRRRVVEGSRATKARPSSWSDFLNGAYHPNALYEHQPLRFRRDAV